MQITSTQLSKFFLFFGTLYYLNILRFFSGFVFPEPEKGNFDEVLAGNPLNKVAGVIILLLGLILVWRSHSIRIKKIIRISWPLLLLFSYLIISISWSSVPFISLRRVVALFTLILFALVIVQVFKIDSLLEHLYSMMLFTIFLGFMWTIVQGKPIVFGLDDQLSGFKGIFIDKNGAARFSAYTFILGLSLKKYATKAQITGIAMVMIAIAASQSASAIIIAIIGTTVVYFFRYIKTKYADKNLLTLIVSICFLLIAALVASVLYDLVLTLLNRDSNLTDRAIIWELLTPLMLEKVTFGYGFGAFWASNAISGFVERWGFIGNSHNGYFEVLLHGGIALFAFYTIMIVKVFFRLFYVFIFLKQDKYTPLCFSIVIVQLISNYIGYLILNHTSFDMFLFTLIFFIVSDNYYNSRFKNESN